MKILQQKASRCWQNFLQKNIEGIYRDPKEHQWEKGMRRVPWNMLCPQNILFYFSRKIKGNPIELWNYFLLLLLILLLGCEFWMGSYEWVKWLTFDMVLWLMMVPLDLDGLISLMTYTLDHVLHWISLSLIGFLSRGCHFMFLWCFESLHVVRFVRLLRHVS